MRKLTERAIGGCVPGSLDTFFDEELAAEMDGGVKRPRRHSLSKSLAEFRRVSGKIGFNLVFPAACTSEKTPLAERASKRRRRFRAGSRG